MSKKRPALPEKIQKIRHKRQFYQEVIDDYCQKRKDLKNELIEIFGSGDGEATNCHQCDIIHCPLRGVSGSFFYCLPTCKYMVKK